MRRRSSKISKNNEKTQKARDRQLRTELQKREASLDQRKNGIELIDRIKEQKALADAQKAEVESREVLLKIRGNSRRNKETIQKLETELRDLAESIGYK